ncbi:MAG: selenocysteine-specific translation elongation factor [Acidobacteria bacterium]|nr:selenocysteine-specific translation elongation factor [Acidobacteriota bacterium]
MKYVIVGTAGHIDHGKTQLVKALTGIDADRLKEEKERGITIDIGFAFLTLDQVRFGFVDVPGHERFVKNMLAGVHGIDIVMLVVAADESIMPQTREHFDICRLLKVKNGLVAITKIDMVDEELIELVEEEVRDFVRGSFLEGAPVVRVSSRTGAGLDVLKAALMTVASQVQEKQTDTLPRLPIDRVFSKRGFGTIVTGTLVSGSLSEGQSVEILPGRLRASIRGLQVHNESVPQAYAGERAAVNLQGLGVDQLERGDVIVPGERLHPTSMLDARLDLLASAPRPLRNRTRVRFHLGTTEVLARVVLLDCEELAPDDSALVQLRLERPTFTLPDDRFIIRHYSPQFTIGGGRVLDALPSKHAPYRADSARSQTVIDQLTRLESGEITERILVWAEVAGRHGITASELAAGSGLSDQQLEPALADLLKREQLVEVSAQPRYFVSASTYAVLKSEMQQLLKQFHQANPLVEGMSREELRMRLSPGTRGDFSTALIARLTQEPQFKAERDWVRLAAHQITFSPEESRQREQLLTVIKEAGYQALTLEEAAQRVQLGLPLARKFIQPFLNQGEVVRLGDLLFYVPLLRDLMEKVRAQKRVSEKLDVASFKQITGVTRKYAIPLLEYLDRQGVTRRVGNDRIIL